MQSAMFSGLFGALTNEHRMNSISNNLANINTTGYKREVLAFKDTFQHFASDRLIEPLGYVRAEKFFPEPDLKARPRLALAQTDFSQGPMKATGNPLDLGISGEGFFKVQTPEGEYFTRNGHFMLNQDGVLVTAQGFPVLGDGGEITVPPEVKNLVIAEDGRVFGDEAQLGQIGVFRVDDQNKLEKFGENLYRAKKGEEVAETGLADIAGEEGVTPPWVAQGFLESPNVDVVYEMVNMIEAQRQFEAYAKVMQTSDAIDRAATTQVGKSR